MARKPAVLMTQKFALPRPAQSKIDEAVGQSARYTPVLPSRAEPATGIAKSLNVQPDPPTPPPRTALFRKRKFEQISDSETDEEEEEEEEEEEGEDWRPKPPGAPGGSPAGIQGERVDVDEANASVDSLFDGSVGGVPEMSGALQDLEGDGLHLYSDD